MIHAQGEQGDVLSWPPFKSLLSSSCKCCQWITLNHHPCGGSLSAMIHPGGGIKAWSLDVSGQPWGAVFIPDPHGVSSGRLASDPAWSFPLLYPVSSLLIPVLTPRASPIHIPALNSIQVCIPESQPATRIRKHSSIRGGLLLKITGYTRTYNILKTPNKIQNGRNKDL